MYDYYTAVSIVVWISLMALCVLIWKNGRIDDRGKRIFYFTYAVIAVSLFSEWLGVQLDGKENLPVYFLYITKCVDYILTPMAASAFVMQMQLKNIWSKILNILLIINAVFQIIASVFGLFFVIDEHHHYSNGPLYFVYFGFCILVLAFVIIQFFIYSRTFPRRNQASMYAIFVPVVVGIALQELFPGGFRTAYLSIALSSALMFIHYMEFHQMRTDKLLETQKSIIETDALTGLLSRFAFTQEMHALGEKLWLPDDFAVFVIDINELKTVNDVLGHSAGDELITGAAKCLRTTMGEFAHCFRIGGDEFVVFSTLDKEQAEAETRKLKKEAKNWAGRYSRNLSLAVGYVIAADYPQASIQQLFDEADKKMYVSKELYYSKKEKPSRSTRFRHHK